MSVRRNGPRRRPAPLKPRLSSKDIPRAARIFVNRNLKMSSVAMIGFDMDHTLAVYRPQAFEHLAFEAAKSKLVESHGYPEEVLSLEYDHFFVIRGLVVDKRKGNILKMDRHHYVSRCFHGTRALDDDTRKELYKGRKIPLGSQTYASIDTLFSLPETSLYAQLVDLVDRRRKRSRRESYRKIYDDVRACVDEAHRDGTIKSTIQANPEYYVMPDENLSLTFDKFRRHGKKLFLLTNSEKSYTEVVMSTLLDGKHPRYRSWKEFFDLIVVSAGKPGFFVDDDPMIHAEGSREGQTATPGDGGKMFLGGCAEAFEAYAGHEGDEILYFGDHTYGDILRSKSTSGWRTAMIIREIEDEIAQQEAAHPHITAAENAERGLDRLLSDRDLLEIEMAADEKRFARTDLDPEERERLKRQLRKRKSGLREIDRRIKKAERHLEASWQAAGSMFNANWGRLFKDRNAQSRFGAQVTRFACIYTSKASNFFYYPVNKLFKPAQELMPHELHD